MLWLGQRNEETGELEEVEVINAKDVGSMPPASFYALTPDERRDLMAGRVPQPLTEGMTEEDRDAMNLTALEDEYYGDVVTAREDIPGPSVIPEGQREGETIQMSNARNALPYFPITEDMQGLEGNYSIHDPVPAWRMAAAQAEGTTERNTCLLYTSPSPRD